MPLTFISDADYSLISAGDRVSTKGFDKLLRDGDLSATVYVVVDKADGSRHEIETEHALSADQVNWLKYGSALNMIKAGSGSA